MPVTAFCKTLKYQEQHLLVVGNLALMLEESHSGNSGHTILCNKDETQESFTMMAISGHTLSRASLGCMLSAPECLCAERSDIVHAILQVGVDLGPLDSAFLAAAARAAPAPAGV